MARRLAWFTAVVGLLFAGSGAARFLHLRTAHVESPITGSVAAGHSGCHHHKVPSPEQPSRSPPPADRCETCFLIAATLKSVAPTWTVLPAVEPLVVERIDIPRTTIVAFARLDAASQRGPPAISA
jgi:hypothetical protein